MKKRLSKIALFAVVSLLALVAVERVAHTAYPDPDYDGGIWYVISNGIRTWAMTGSSSSFQILNRNTATAARQTALSIDATTNAAGLQQYTSSQLSTLAPPASGYIVVNVTAAGLCISTGTGAGAWVTPISTASATNMLNGTRPQCY